MNPLRTTFEKTYAKKLLPTQVFRQLLADTKFFRKLPERLFWWYVKTTCIFEILDLENSWIECL